jgi:hypothetical protein
MSKKPPRKACDKCGAYLIGSERKGTTCNQCLEKAPVNVVVFIQGGCYETDLADGPVNLYVFDWDNFEAAPEEYWEYCPQDMKDFLKQHSEMAYNDIMEKIAEAAAEREREAIADSAKAEAIQAMN